MGRCSVPVYTSYFVDPAITKDQGDDYAKNAQLLWQRCVQTFSEAGSINMDSDELLLCLKYDCAVAPSCHDQNLNLCLFIITC